MANPLFPHRGHQEVVLPMGSPQKSKIPEFPTVSHEQGCHFRPTISPNKSAWNPKILSRHSASQTMGLTTPYCVLVSLAPLSHGTTGVIIYALGTGQNRESFKSCSGHKANIARVLGGNHRNTSYGPTGLFMHLHKRNMVEARRSCVLSQSRHWLCRQMSHVGKHDCCGR